MVIKIVRLTRSVDLFPQETLADARQPFRSYQREPISASRRIVGHSVHELTVRDIRREDQVRLRSEGRSCNVTFDTVLIEDYCLNDIPCGVQFRLWGLRFERVRVVPAAPGNSASH